MFASSSAFDHTEASTATGGELAGSQRPWLVTQTEDGTDLGSGSTSCNRASVLRAGSRFERYEILSRLGAGGMGEVFAARDTQLDREVALKLIKPRDRKDDTAYTQLERVRLFDEAQALARLSHPNVVQVYEVGHHAGETFLAMELVDGPTLRDWQPASLAELLRVYTDAARGLVAAHAVGLVHRDFKPANVLLGHDGRVRVADFGLALRPAPERAETLGDGSESGNEGRSGTRSSSSVAGPGTLPYMAPEQAFFGAGGEAADQFSFCVALFEAVYGRRPFPARGAMELLYKLDLCKVEFPEDPRFSPPRWLRSLLLRGLSRREDQRYPSMEALVAELSRDRSKRWRRVGVVGLAAGLATSLTLLAITPTQAPARAVDAPSLAGVWDSARRAELGESFARLDTPWAAGSASSVLAGLDHWAERWDAATRDGESRDARVRRSVRACLAGQRAQAEVLVDAMAEGLPVMLEGAVAAVDALPEPSRCTAPSTIDLETAQAPGLTPEQLRAQLVILAEAAAQRSLGHFELAHTSADAVLSDARASELVSLELAALRQRGLAQIEAGRQRAGLDDLLAARDLAIANTDLRAQAELSVELAWLSRKLDNAGLRHDRLQVGRAHVDALLSAAGSEAADRHALELRARVELAAALDALELGETASARELHDEGLAVLAAFGAGAAGLALDYEHARANIQRQAGELDRAETSFVALLDSAARVRGADHPLNAGAWYDAASLAHQRGDLELARARMLRSRDLRRASLRIDHPDLALSELGMAAIELAAGNDNAARAHASLALESLERPGIRSDALPDALRYLGMLSAREGRWAEAETHYRRARSLLGDDPLQRAQIELGLGLALAERGGQLEASELLGAALPVLDAYLTDTHCRRLVKGYERHADAARALGQLERARTSLARARACTTRDDTRARLDAALASL